MGTFKVEYIQSIDITSKRQFDIDTYYHFRINGIDCSIELFPDSALEIGTQLGLEMERVFNLVMAAQETHRLEKCVAYINEEARH